ncbi:Uma2 family endonuclease [bacterium]|nr:Uma2 family endonuclease [bacterium]
MTITPDVTYCTPEEYLEKERTAEAKSEYRDGETYAMAGASRAHNLITLNTAGELRSALRSRPCETYMNDMRVKVAKSRLYTYPDVVVVCGEPRFEDSKGDVLMNPTVIVEVLSPSTASYDRGDKFFHYRRLPSLQEYVLIAQDSRRVEHYTRQGDQWLLTEFSESDQIVIFPTIACQIPLTEIYARVEFPDEEAAQSG